MPHKLRKHRRMRGSRTQGYGRIGQHRDSGSKGARKVGRHKHLWSLVCNEKVPYFGKHGFHSPQALHHKGNVINLTKLDQLVTTETNINLTSMGYTKLLGTGKITKALIITIPTASKTAQEKIKQAGGKLIIETEQEIEKPQE
jgi:large subunit ribosomal protein L15